MKRVFVIITFLSVNFFSFAETGVVKSVIDGNTLTIEVEQDEMTFVIADIDCPELDQEYGLAAKEKLEALLLNKTVKIELKGKDRKGNRVAQISVNDIDVRMHLIDSGLAWVDERSSNQPLKDLQDNAKASQKGLWKQEDPTPPWIFRRQQSMLVPKSS